MIIELLIGSVTAVVLGSLTFADRIHHRNLNSDSESADAVRRRESFIEQRRVIQERRDFYFNRWVELDNQVPTTADGKIQKASLLDKGWQDVTACDSALLTLALKERKESR